MPNKKSAIRLSANILNYFAAFTETRFNFRTLINYQWRGNEFFYKPALLDLSINRIRTKPIGEVLQFIPVQTKGNSGHDEPFSDQEFLHQWGFLIRKDEILQSTRASILLFGAPAAIHQMLPRPTLDVQWIPSDFGEPLPEIRWLDRMVFEDNLIITWRGLVTSYMQKAEKPFRIDPHTLLRNDAPPEYRVFREAAINLLIHQDYASHGFKAVIKFYRNVIQFWNPGDVFGNADHLLEPGEKEVRKTFEIRLSLKQNQVTGEVTPPVTPPVKLLIGLLGEKGELGAGAIREAFGLKDRTHVRNTYIVPALEAELIEYTIPDKPRSSKQKYRLTDNGKEWVEQNQAEK